MVRSPLHVVLALGFFCAVSSGSPVEVLSASNFTVPTGIDDKGVLTFFFAPWCGHCKKFHPEYNTLADSYTPPPGVPASASPSFTKVDAVEEVALAEKYNVYSYPTLYYFPSGSSDGKAGTPVKYGGANNVDELKKFLDRQVTGFQVYEVDTVEDYNNFVGAMNEQLVVLLKSGADSNAAGVFQSIYLDVISDELLRRKTIYFGRVDGGADFGPGCESDCLEVWNKVTGVRKVLTEGALTKEGMTNFIVGVGSVMDPYASAMLSKSQSNSIVKRFVMVVSSPDQVQPIKEALVEEITSNHLGKIGATWVDPEETPVILEHYRLEGILPVVLLMDISGGAGTIVTKLVPAAELEGEKLVENLRNCYNDYNLSEKCSATPRARSEAAKKGNMKTIPIKKLVGKNLRRNILQAEEKDQFVYFYSLADKEEWRNAEEFNAMASRYQMEPTIDFFKFDVDLNDVTIKEIEVGSTPVMWFFPADNKQKPVRFEAEEFLNEHMFDFLWKQVTIPFKGYVTERKYVGLWGRIKHMARKLKRKFFPTKEQRLMLEARKVKTTDEL